MKKVMMIYKIPNGDSVLRISFNRKLLNYNIQSHKGKYKTKTKGILDKFEKPTKSCIIFEKKFLSDVKKLCKEVGVDYMLYQIEKLKN